jgi:tRNA U38,U39,U40 pseudouridine synthase TruA
MVGMIVSLFQNDLNVDFLKNSLNQNQVYVWLAPSEGLLLHSIFFKPYNNKKDIPEKIELNQKELEECEDFKIN